MQYLLEKQTQHIYLSLKKNENRLNSTGGLTEYIQIRFSSLINKVAYQEHFDNNEGCYAVTCASFSISVNLLSAPKVLLRDYFFTQRLLKAQVMQGCYRILQLFTVNYKSKILISWIYVSLLAMLHNPACDLMQRLPEKPN